MTEVERTDDKWLLALGEFDGPVKFVWFVRSPDGSVDALATMENFLALYGIGKRKT